MQRFKPFYHQLPCQQRNYISNKDKANATLFLKTNGLAGKRILALGLGSNFAGKIWPVSAFIALTQAFSECFDAVLLFGNQQQSVYVAEFIANDQGLVIDAHGQSDLMQISVFY